MNELEVYNRKFDEYYFEKIKKCLPNIQTSKIKDWPLIRFNIQQVYDNFSLGIDEPLRGKLMYKLIDIKMVYSFLLVLNYENLETTLIVGKNELEKLNPNTISLLRRNHYKVYLISILTEMLLDLFQIIFLGKITDHSKNKWSKIYDEIKPGVSKYIEQEEFKILSSFKDKYRTSELHKFSKIRGVLSKDKWDHLETESELVSKIINRLNLQ